MGETAVRVGAGITLFELCDYLESHELSLLGLAIRPGQTLAGALATGTHGGSYQRGSLCSDVLAIRYINGKGESIECLRGDPDFRFVLPAMGMIGVLLDVTLQVQPRCDLIMRQQNHPFEEFCDRYSSMATSNEFFSAVWLPGLSAVASFAAVRHPSRVTYPQKRELRYSARIVAAHWLSARCGIAASALWNPRHGEEMISCGTSSDILAPIATPRSRVLFTRRLITQPLESEFSVDFERTPEVLRRLRDYFIDLGQIPPAPLGVRPGGPEDFCMSPNHSRPGTWISVFLPRGSALMGGIKSIFEDVGARPHWGKDLLLSPDAIRRQYPRWQEFWDFARRNDPSGLFKNSYATYLLGDEA